ncbi:GAF domain-containing protein [Oscillatoria sp. FACHB-1407]|uniref:GAF domain-containing sensor histidine kinase n=1 Tax=Oscillatoria sp. FACHB-1407 TaxID=2692847 RepID=UPI00168679F5|nr:ATP-binding protein [Oscillatoria sp. FACHB-1407]MBD2464927.1 GAF domain-containing protein [Oscillatoria sp. FACHB-1407]
MVERSSQQSSPGDRDDQQQNATPTELRQQQSEVELFSDVALKLHQSLYLKDILHTTVTEVQRILQADRVLIYHVLPDGRGKIVDESVSPEYPPLIHQEFAEEVFPADYQQLYAQGRVQAIADVHHPASGLAECLVKFVDQFGIKAKLVVPIVQTLNNQAQDSLLLPQLWGLLIAHQCQSVRSWVEVELELLQKLAAQISLALSQAQYVEHLQAALQQEQRDRQTKDELIAVMSHDVRTSLTSLHSALKILGTGRLGNLSSEGHQMLAIADESTERLMRLVNHVLDLQRMESGNVVMNYRECNAADLITQAALVMQPMAQQHGITLITQPEAIAVWADADYILQALTNLLSNAIKFSPVGGKVWLTVTHTPHLLSALFQVRDQGQGIPANQLERIFDWFQQVDPADSHRRGGTGLGLAICRKIVEQHNGRIWAESTPGNGSTFALTLPLAQANPKSEQD